MGQDGAARMEATALVLSSQRLATAPSLAAGRPARTYSAAARSRSLADPGCVVQVGVRFTVFLAEFLGLPRFAGLPGRLRKRLPGKTQENPCFMPTPSVCRITPSGDAPIYYFAPVR